MSGFFKYFPKTVYDDIPSINITKRIKIRDSLESRPYVFLPYQVSGIDRPEDIAYLYYGSVEYTWLVFMANDIIDPYHQWVMPDDKFYEYMKSKYATESGATGWPVIAWTQAEIKHYKNNTDGDLTITKDTYDYSDAITAGEWTAVYVYDYEDELNESRRNIRLVNKSYAKSIEKELKRLLA